MSDGFIDGEYYKYPHCDSNVLHAPEDGCIYCNAYPQRQQQRIDTGINFTGHYNSDKELCPSEIRRNLEKIDLWPGNRIHTQEMENEREEFFHRRDKKLTEIAKNLGVKEDSYEAWEEYYAGEHWREVEKLGEMP